MYRPINANGILWAIADRDLFLIHRNPFFKILSSTQYSFYINLHSKALILVTIDSKRRYSDVYPYLTLDPLYASIQTWDHHTSLNGLELNQGPGKWLCIRSVECDQSRDVQLTQNISLEMHMVMTSAIPFNSFNSPHKGQWRGALMFSSILAWTNGWVNNRDVGDLRDHRAHYDVTVMNCWTSFTNVLFAVFS